MVAPICRLEWEKDDQMKSDLEHYQARSVLYAYMHVRTWSDQKILKFLAILSIFNILLVHNQD